MNTEHHLARIRERLEEIASANLWAEGTERAVAITAVNIAVGELSYHLKELERKHAEQAAAGVAA